MAVNQATKQESKKYRRYTEQQWREAIADVAALGLTASATKHEVARTTLSSWVSGEKRPRGWTPGWPVTEVTALVVAPAAVSELAATSEAAKPVEAAAPAAAVPTAKAKRRVAKRYTPTQKAQLLEAAAEEGQSATAEKFGVSRYSLHEWRRKVEKAAAGEGSSPTSGPDPQDIEAQRDREILGEWHNHPGLGPSQIRNQLRRKSIKVSVNTVRHVMEDAGYRPPKVKSQKHDQRYEAVRPNHIWHADYVQRYIHRTSTFSLIFIDDHSRYVVGHGIDDAERADMVIKVFEEAVARHGKPEAMMHDKGSAFWSWRGISRFTALLTELGATRSWPSTRSGTARARSSTPTCRRSCSMFTSATT